MPIVNQKLVRRTVRRRSGSVESNQKRKNALEIAAAQDRDEDGVERDQDADRAEVARLEVGRVERQEEDGEDARDQSAEAVHGGLPDELAQAVGEHSEASVESEQAVGDPLEVVDLLGVGAALGADPAPLGGRLGERAKRLDQVLPVGADDRDARAEGLLGARASPRRGGR